MPDSYICPSCDTEVIVGSSCRICSKTTPPEKKQNKKPNKTKSKKKIVKKPWEQDELYDGLDLPDEFDYDEFIKQEFEDPHKPYHTQIQIAWYWWLTAIALIILTIYSIYRYIIYTLF